MRDIGTGANTFGVGSEDIRRPLDVAELDSHASEYSWGEGLEPADLRDAPPSEGGRYRGQSDEGPPQVGINRR